LIFLSVSVIGLPLITTAGAKRTRETALLHLGQSVSGGSVILWMISKPPLQWSQLFFVSIALYSYVGIPSSQKSR